jgi:thioredoxin-like negative regulator of GroEL
MAEMLFQNRQQYMMHIKQLGNSVVVVKAHAPWCGPCRRSTPLVNQLFSQLVGTRKHLIHLNVDENPDVATYLRIRGIPHMVSYVNGEPMDVLSSGDPDAIKTFFAKVQTRLNSL